MNTLTNAPLADLLQRLFAEAEASAPGDSPALADLSEAELKRLMGSKTEYREFYGRLKDLALPVSPRNRLPALHAGAQQLGAQHRRVRHVLRPVHPAPRRSAAGQRRWPPDRQRVRTLQGRAGTAQPGRRGLLDLVELREGDALQTLAKDLPDSIDLVLLDGAKALYPEVLALLESRLRPGALVIADNAEHSPEYLAHVRSPANGYLSTPFAEDVEAVHAPGLKPSD